jgi:hypothetical protein
MEVYLMPKQWKLLVGRKGNRKVRKQSFSYSRVPPSIIRYDQCLLTARIACYSNLVRLHIRLYLAPSPHPNADVPASNTDNIT